jgi:hypothetical protein
MLLMLLQNGNHFKSGYNHEAALKSENQKILNSFFSNLLQTPGPGPAPGSGSHQSRSAIVSTESFSKYKSGNIDRATEVVLKDLNRSTALPPITKRQLNSLDSKQVTWTTTIDRKILKEVTLNPILEKSIIEKSYKPFLSVYYTTQGFWPISKVTKGHETWLWLPDRSKIPLRVDYDKNIVYRIGSWTQSYKTYFQPNLLYAEIWPIKFVESDHMTFNSQWEG